MTKMLNRLFNFVFGWLIRRVTHEVLDAVSAALSAAGSSMAIKDLANALKTYSDDQLKLGQERDRAADAGRKEAETEHLAAIRAADAVYNTKMVSVNGIAAEGSKARAASNKARKSVQVFNR